MSGFDGSEPARSAVAGVGRKATGSSRGERSRRGDSSCWVAEVGCSSKVACGDGGRTFGGGSSSTEWGK